MTNVNNNYENNRRFYQFLQQNDGWEEEMAGSDGIISKAEFKKYFNDNFDFSSIEGKQDDLVNSFWNSMNINTSGTVSGSKLTQKGAMDKKEQQAMMNRIEADERVTEFVSGLDIPSFVKDETGCKKQIFAKLMDLVEKNILKKYKNLDDLDTLLENNVKAIKNAAVAEIYANECVAEYAKEAVEKYDYKVDDDQTLKNMIKNLAKRINAETTEDEIQSAIEGLVKGYLATAGLGDGEVPAKVSQARVLAADGEVETEETVDGLSADDVWYNPTDNSSLNDLQKAVIEKNLKNAKEAILKEYGADYTNYKSLFDNAFEEFIADTLKNTKFGEFEAASKFGKAEFEATEIYKNLEKTVNVKNLLTDKTQMQAALEENFKNIEGFEKMPEYLVDKVAIRKNREFYDILNTIENGIIQRVLNGEFLNDDGKIDEDAILKEVVALIKKNIVDLYKEDNLGQNTQTDIITIYRILDSSAEESNDAQGQRNAAKMFCKAIVAKGTKHEETVKNVVGANYAEVIDGLDGTGIDLKMNELIRALNELGDADDFELGANAWGNLSYGSTISYDLEAVRADALKYLNDNGIIARLEECKEQIRRTQSTSQVTRVGFFHLPTGNAGYSMTMLYNINQLQSCIDQIKTTNDYRQIQKLMEQIIKDSSAVLSGINRPEWNMPQIVTPNETLNIEINTTRNFTLTPEFTNGGKAWNVTSDRITYECSNDHVSVDANGNVTVNAGSQVGDFDTTIKILVDGVEVGKKLFRIKVNPVFDSASMSGTSFTGIITTNGNKDNQFNQTVDLKDAYEGNYVLELSPFNGDWGTVRATAHSRIDGLLQTIKSGAANSGLNQDALERAYQKTKALYDAIIEGHGGKAGKKSNQIRYYTYEGQAYAYDSHHWYREGSAGGCDTVQEMGGQENNTGIRWNYSWAGDDSDQFYVNIRCVIDLFNKFYKEEFSKL